MVLSNQSPGALEINPFVHVALATATPSDAAAIGQKIRSSASKDKAPSAQAATNTLPSTSLSTLTSNFDVTRIPLTMLKQMQRDPMIAFAMFFIKAEMLRARWSIQCPDPQVAAFVDNALREIWPSLVSEYMLKFAHGFRAVIKRFQLTNPDWTYVDPNNPAGGEKLVWDQQAVQAVTFKPFAGLPPEAVDPLWTNDGDFDGIKYTPSRVISLGTAPGEEAEFDVMHSLWFTNEKESVNGSLWGYPRIGYAYRFWWSFWFNWGLADRHFEKDADPPAIVYYPSNKPPLVDPQTGQEISRRDQALKIGDLARSNSTIAMPGDPVVADDGSVKTMREWEIDFAKGGGNFQTFRERFDQLQVLILRACMVPEQAFLEGQGGTSSRNVAGELQDAFSASQIVNIQELDMDVNRFVIPHLVAANFADRNVKAIKVTKGYDSNDIELQKMIIQAIANQDATALPIDLDSMVEAVGLPKITPAQIAAQTQQQTQQAQQTKPEPQPATPGQAGVNKQGLYYQARDQIHLYSAAQEAEAAFFAELVSVAALRDPLVMTDAMRLRNVWQQALTYDFAVAQNLVNDYGSNIDLDETFFERFMRRISNRAHETVFQTRRVLASIMRRGSTIEMEKVGLKDFSWDPFYSPAASKYLSERAAEMVTGISNTTRDQVKVFLADLVKRNVPVSHMPAMLDAHFRMFSGWRADQIVRTEIGRAYNMATLLAAQDAGIKQVQAIDAQFGPDRSDPECIARNGRIFTVEEAFIEQDKEHPNGTLQWRILRKPVTVKRLPVPANRPAGILAAHEETDEEIIVSLPQSFTDQQQNDYLIALVDKLSFPEQTIEAA